MMMKQVKSQQGYALLVVLLVVVLFLSLSAAFMAASLSNSEQEHKIDVSNQAVAAAEMGITYFSVDFQHEIDIIKSDIIELTQKRIKKIVDCFNSGDLTCDDQSELTAMENQIDEDMRNLYISRINDKIAALDRLKNIQHTPFQGEDVHYAITATSIIKQNAAGENVELSDTSDKNIRYLKVQLDLSGKAKEDYKELKGLFTVEVPETFLSTSNNLTIQTTSKVDEELSYENMFVEEWPSKSCITLMNEINNNKDQVQYECLLEADQNASDFVKFLLSKDLDPEDFKIFTNDFLGNICGDNCNNLSFNGITVVTKTEVDGSFNDGGNNLNSWSSMNLVVDGHFKSTNMNSLGKHSETQILIFRELTVSSNIQGGGLTNTNLLILGKNYTEDGFVPDSRMNFEGNLTIGDNGRICFDMDKISTPDIDNLSKIAKFTNNNTTGQIIYYTSDPNKKFVLRDVANNEDMERTTPYVIGYNNYTTFLSSCGIDVTKVTTEILDLPYPYIRDPEFGLDVEY